MSYEYASTEAIAAHFTTASRQVVWAAKTAYKDIPSVLCKIDATIDMAKETNKQNKG